MQELFSLFFKLTFHKLYKVELTKNKRKRIMIVPDLVRQKVAALGAEGSRWLLSLGDLIRDLEQEWQVTVGSSLAGGSEAYVAQGRTRDGAQVILKIAIPENDGNTVLANEIIALTLADGHGYVRLLRSDLSRRALLLEPLGIALRDLGYSTRAQIDIICTTLKEAWLPIPSGSQLPSGASTAQWHANFSANLWERLDRPCSQQALEMALSFAQARAKAFDPEIAVLVHGDAHSGNTLQTLSQNSQMPSSFKLIDPDGLIAEAAYDPGVLMREWRDELMPDPVRLGRERCAYLNQITGADTQAIWQWGFIQCMSSGLLLLQVGQQQAGIQMLKVAEAWTQA
jgi:streptomycin 6-kinase